MRKSGLLLPYESITFLIYTLILAQFNDSQKSFLMDVMSGLMCLVDFVRPWTGVEGMEAEEGPTGGETVKRSRAVTMEGFEALFSD